MFHPVNTWILDFQTTGKDWRRSGQTPGGQTSTKSQKMTIFENIAFFMNRNARSEEVYHFMGIKTICDKFKAK